MNHFKSIIGLCACCDLCGKWCAITLRDRGTGMMVGNCCRPFLFAAHQMIESALASGGPRHPEPGEFSSRDDH